MAKYEMHNRHQGADRRRDAKGEIAGKPASG
jgi:hypothetical protein